MNQKTIVLVRIYRNLHLNHKQMDNKMLNYQILNQMMMKINVYIIKQLIKFLKNFMIGKWFGQLSFYRFGMVYMFFRLYSNVSSTMISFYIESVLKFKNSDAENVQIPIQVALIPLSLYIMSVITSVSLSKLYKLLGKKITLTVGTILCLLTSFALIFLNEDNAYFMYAISPFIGIAQAITLNTGIALISDVIGLKGQSGAFVFGAYSCLDKISSGIVLFFCSYGNILDDQNLILWLTVLV